LRNFIKLSMNKDKSLQTKFALVMFFMYMGHAFAYTLILPYLSYLGYSSLQQGKMMALGALLTLIFQFYVGYLCDKYQTDKIAFYLVCLLYAFINWLFYRFLDNPAFLVVLYVALVSTLFRIARTTLDCWIIESGNSLRANYGGIRAFGSGGWALAAPLTSYLLAKGGYAALGDVFVLITVITLVISYFIADAAKTKTTEKIKLSDLKVLLTNINYILYTVIFLMVFTALTAEGYIVTYKIMQLAEKQALLEAEIAALIGYKSAIAAICELPVYFIGAGFLKRFGTIKTLLAATVVLMLKFLLLALASTTGQILWLTALTIVTLPFFIICCRLLIAELTPNHLMASGQQLSAAIYGGISALLAPLLFGWLGQTFGNNFALLVLALSMGLPLLLLFWSQRSMKKQVG